MAKLPSAVVDVRSTDPIPDPIIPDSGGTHQWSVVKGSGTTLTDSIGSLDGNINGATWDNTIGGTGGTTLSYTDDETKLPNASSDFSHFIENLQGTVAMWVRFKDNRNGRTQIFTDGNGVSLRLNSGTVSFLGPTINTLPEWEISTNTAPIDEWFFVAGTVDGSTARLYSAMPYDNSLTQVDSESVSETGTATTNDGTFYDTTNSETTYIDIAYTNNTADSQATLGSWFDNTVPYYPNGIARFNFEQSYTNSWGPNNGTPSGNPTFATDSKVGAYSVDLDGDDYIDSAAEADSPMAVSVWAKPDVTADGDIWAAIGDSLQTRFGLSGNGDIVWYTFDGSTLHGSASGYGSYNEGVWNHFVAQHTGSAYQVYHNGSLLGEVTDSSFSLTSINKYIGARNNSSGPTSTNFVGQLDDFRIYPFSLSSTQVSNLYNTDNIR